MDFRTKAYWWKGAPNFGDSLAPLLLQYFSELQVEWAPAATASVASVGSILEHLTSQWSGYILGSGKLRENSDTSNWGKTATIIALRGPLSARGIKGSFALGDPGLLADELVGVQEKVWDLGILPHWRDTELALRFPSLVPKQATIKIINPLDNPLTVLKQIGACRRMVTSSLHGMIVSDAFGVPRRVETCAVLSREGGDFKFRDYCASIQSSFTPGVMMEPVSNYVDQVRFELQDAYRALGYALGNRP